jgi:hypothetical protein
VRIGYEWSRLVNFDFSVTIISLRNVPYVRTSATHALSRMASPNHAESRMTIFGFELITVCMTLVEATQHNLSFSI